MEKWTLELLPPQRKMDPGAIANSEIRNPVSFMYICLSDAEAPYLGLMVTTPNMREKRLVPSFSADMVSPTAF